MATSCFLTEAYKASWEVTRTNSFNNVELPAVICDILDAQNISVISELIINRSSSFSDIPWSIFVLGALHYFVPEEAATL